MKGENVMKRKLLYLKKEESTQTKMALVTLLAIGWLMVGSVVQAQDDVDLSTWTAESYPAVSGFGAGVWTVAGDNLSVFQSVNGQPTLFYSDFAAFNTNFQGKIKVETTGDNDFIGFALGFQPGDTSNSSADYLLVDWKQGDQSYNFGPPSCTPGSFAPRGLAVSRVFGIPTADEFWGHTNFDTPACSDLNNGLLELQRGATLGGTGWADNTEYEFTFEFSSTSLRVFVDGTPEIDITGSFSDGRIAFYNFSQAFVRYSGFTVAPLVLDVEIDIKPGSYPNSINPNAGGVIPVAILSTADFDASTVNPETVALEGAAARGKGKSGRYGSMEDVDGDGYLDLVVQVVNEIDWAENATEATLTGETYDGIPIQGTDTVNIVPPD
jgi:hypothetical protein